MKKKKVLFFITSVILITTVRAKKLNNSDYNIVDKDYYATYLGGKVYIGSKGYINKLDDITNNDILIIDERYKEDPNIRVKDSYKINNNNDRKNIIRIILDYEKRYPSDWDRSYKSMLFEWKVHNILYQLGYNKKRTSEVDFNNEDEYIYSLRGK